MKRLRHKKVHKKRLFFKTKNIMRHCGENEIPNFFLENATFFEDPIFSLKNPIVFIENPNFLSKIRIFSKTYEIWGVVLCYILLFENIRNPVFGHFPSFPASSFMPRVTYLQYLTQCGVKPGLYSVRRSTQTELRKQIYAHTRIMAFILLRRSRRICMRIVGVFTLGICAIPTA